MAIIKKPNPVKNRLGKYLYSLANFLMDRVPLVGYPLGGWLKDRKIVEDYYLYLDRPMQFNPTKRSKG